MKINNCSSASLSKEGMTFLNPRMEVEGFLSNRWLTTNPFKYLKQVGYRVVFLLVQTTNSIDVNLCQEVTLRGISTPNINEHRYIFCDLWRSLGNKSTFFHCLWHYNVTNNTSFYISTLSDRIKNTYSSMHFPLWQFY